MRCPFCGAENSNDAKYCEYCNSYFEENTDSKRETVINQNIYITNNSSSEQQSKQEDIRLNSRKKNKWVALVLCIFFGFWGVHRFYENKKVTGVLYFFTLGLLGIGWFIDIIIILTKPTTYYV